MKVQEESSWSLAKLSDVSLVGHALLWVRDLVKVYKSFIRVGVEHIIVFNRVLLASEDQVNPVMEIG